MDQFTRRKDIPKHVTNLAKKFRSAPTKQEAILWEYLAKKRFMGLKFRRQHPIGRYIADFYNHTYKIVIEVDGKIHNVTKEYDKNRDKYFAANNITVLRVANNEIEMSIPEVLNKIELTIENAIQRNNN